MTQKSRLILKSFFETGDKPTEPEFVDLIDSVPNFADDFLTEYVKIEVSSAEILAINTSPKQLVAAPGAGKVLILQHIVVYYHFSVAAYATNTNIDIRNTTGTNYLQDLHSIINEIADRIVETGRQYPPLIVNEPLILTEPTGNPTGGSGTLTIYLWYKEITL